MFAHASQLCEGSDDGTLATPGRGRWELRRRCAAAVRFEDSKQKARDGFLRAGFCSFRDDGVMPVICPTCQTVFEWSTNYGKFEETVSIN
jgi:hypothetical protein